MPDDMKCDNDGDGCDHSILHLHCKNCMKLKSDNEIDKKQPTHLLTATIDNVRKILVLKCYFCEEIVYMLDQ